MNAPIVDHSKNTLDVIPSSDNGDDKLFTKNPLEFSSTFSWNIEGEFVCFSSTPPFDSSDHEDVDEIIDFADHSCRDLWTPVFNHDGDSIIVNFSKSPVYDDLSVDEAEIPQAVEALHTKLMVMSRPCYPEVGFTFDQEIVEMPKAPHQSSVCIEDQSHTQIMLPPLKLHDPNLLREEEVVPLEK